MNDWVLCINRSWTTEHLVSPATKKTKCGLKWAKGKKGDVWVPMAAYFSAGRKCKVCFPRKARS